MVYKDSTFAEAHAESSGAPPGRIRILFLIDQLAGPHGGTEQHAFWLMKSLPEQAFEMHFIVLSRVLFDRSDWPVPMTVISDLAGRGPVFWLRRLMALTSYVRKNRIDVIHALCPMSEFMAAMSLLLGGRAKIVGGRRNLGYSLTRWRALRTRLIQALPIRYVANSAEARAAAVQRESVPQDRIAVIPNPINTGRYQEGIKAVIPREELAREDEFIVAMVATVRPIKDYETFIISAGQVVQEYPNTVFLAVGALEDGFRELDDLVMRLGLENRFRWFEKCENPFSLLPNVDVAVLCSRSESFSNAALEYAVSGLPSVVTDVGGLRDIVVHDRSGYVVKPGDADEIARCICKLLTDPEQRALFGEYARGHVHARYSQESVLDRYVTFYRQLVE